MQMMLLEPQSHSERIGEESNFHFCREANSNTWDMQAVVQSLRTLSLKHFIIQQMHKYMIRRYNYNYFKIF